MGISEGWSKRLDEIPWPFDKKKPNQRPKKQIVEEELEEEAGWRANVEL